MILTSRGEIMNKKRRSIAAFSTIICLFSIAEAQADEFNNLQKILNKADQPQNWTAPPATPTPQAFAPLQNNYMRQGMPYSSESINALKHSAIWRYMKNPAYAGAPAGQPGGNPFNLSPFGMLHYMWDDTNYVSDANPVTLYQTQNELQTAEQYSQMAQAAASRARYARNPEEREEAARQSQYYAGLAKQAAHEAKEVSQSGSLNPAEVAQAAVEQAKAAQASANQASRYSQRGF